MSIHDISIDGLLAGMPKKIRNQLRQRIFKLISDFNNGDPPDGGNVKSLKKAREQKRNGVVQLR